MYNELNYKVKLNLQVTTSLLFIVLMEKSMKKSIQMRNGT